jgi:hypothetical protein
LPKDDNAVIEDQEKGLAIRAAEKVQISFNDETLEAHEHRPKELTQMEAICPAAVRERRFLDFPVSVLGKRHPDKLIIQKGPHSTTRNTHRGGKGTIADGNHLTVRAKAGNRKAKTCHIYLTPNDGQISGKHELLKLSFIVKGNTR